MYLGDFTLGDTLDFKFTTRQVTGAPFTLAGSPVVSAYPGNSTTQLTAGITLSVDFDSVTGLHNVRVVASSGNGYATATTYAMVITTGTVNSVSVVGEVVAHFSIENRSVRDSAGVTTLLTRITSGLFTGITSLAQWLGLLGGKQTGNATARTELRATGGGSGTFDETTDSQEAIRDNMGTAQTGDSFARIGANGAGLSAVPWNAAWDAEVQSEVDDALKALSLDKLVIVSGTADSGSTTTMVDAARTEADNDYWKGRILLFTSGNLAGQCAIIIDFVAASDTFTFAPAVTQAVATQTYVILPAISVWDDALAEHLAAGSTGAALNAAGAAGDPWTTALPGAYGAGTAGQILGDNLNATISSRASAASLATAQTDLDDIQTRLPAALVGGRMDSSVGAMANNVVTAAAIASNSIDRNTFAIDTGLRSANSGTTPGISTTTVIPLDSGTAINIDDAYNGMTLVITGGAGTFPQSRLIVDYNGTTFEATVFPPFTAVQPALATYSVMPWGPASVARWAETPVTATQVAVLESASLYAAITTLINDILRTDSSPIPTGVPSDTVSMSEQLARLYQVLINGLVVDSGTSKLQFKNAAGTVIWEKDLTDAAGVYTESKGNTP